MNSKILAFLLVLLVAGHPCLARQAGSQGKPDSQADPGEVIGPDDSVTITEINSEEISKSWRVSSSGDLDLPLVGRVHAAGLSTEQLAENLTERLRQYVRNPHVVVFISESRSRPVVIAGAVHHPGTYQADSGTTLLAVIQMAAGLDAPGPNLIVTRELKYGPLPLPGTARDADGQHTSVELLIQDVTDPSNPASNLQMQPHDVISVLSQRHMIYVVGEVNRPGAIELVTQNTLSLIQTLATAGGLTKLSAPRNAEIMRQDRTGVYKMQGKVDLKALMTGKIEDRLLSPGDILFVPSSILKSYTQTASASLLTTGSLLLARF
jgi:polysaccharide export outer membrane protein